MKPILRASLTAGALLWLLLFTAVPAGAHASLRASQPAGGSAVEEAPEQVTISFTEPPDTALTSVKVTGASGSFEDGPPRLAEGDNLSVVVDLKDLPKGSYTVSWRTVSTADGHSSAGAFAFGVGEPPGEVAAEETAQTASRLPLAVSRWVLYLGLVSLVGAAWMSVFAFARTPRSVRRLALAGWGAAVLGFLGLALTQFRDSEVDLGVFLGSSSGRALAFRAAPLLVIGLAFLFLRARDRLLMAAAGVGALGVMLAHAAAGHAAVPPSALTKVGLQWVHFAAVGIWIGGLAALLLGIRHAPEAERQSAARRFSFVAAFAILAVTATGVLRGVHEVGGWEPLFDGTYGRLVIAKSVLLVGLGALGARNRFRNVAVAGSAPQGLQKVGRIEVGVAVVTLALAGLLASSVPPVSVAAAAEEARVTVEGSDFAETVLATLTIEPGTAGPNRFRLALTDPDSEDPIEDVEGATLRFTSLSNPSVGESSVEMEQAQEGRFQATGSNVSVDGRWRVVATVTTAGNSVEIPLEFSTRAVGYTSDRSVVEGQPTIYQVIDPQGRQLQVYAQPDEPGRSELHLTLFDASGTELAVDEIVAIAEPPGDPSISLATRRFGPGHFVADVTLTEGRYRFDVTFTAAGETLRFPAEMRVR
jgi:copper transport protein